jgi:hypothetical protein
MRVKMPDRTPEVQIRSYTLAKVEERPFQGRVDAALERWWRVQGLKRHYFFRDKLFTAHEGRSSTA